jgi:hypothetical protein
MLLRAIVGALLGLQVATATFALAAGIPGVTSFGTDRGYG